MDKEKTWLAPSTQGLKYDPLYCYEKLGAESDSSSTQGEMLIFQSDDRELRGEDPEVLSNGKLYYCPKCCKHLKCKRSLENHIKRHSGYAPYQCPVCEKAFIEKGTLTNHMRTHTDDRPFRCEQPGCQKKFKCKSNLADHMKSCKDDREFKCDICSKGFNRPYLLNRHRITHSQDKPFACHICSSRFNQKANLVVHMKIHSDDKPFLCRFDGCFRRFRTKAHLKYHETSKKHLDDFLAV